MKSLYYGICLTLVLSSFSISPAQAQEKETCTTAVSVVDGDKATQYALGLQQLLAYSDDFTKDELLIMDEISSFFEKSENKIYSMDEMLKVKSAITKAIEKKGLKQISPITQVQVVAFEESELPAGDFLLSMSAQAKQTSTKKEVTFEVTVSLSHSPNKCGENLVSIHAAKDKKGRIPVVVEIK